MEGVDGGRCRLASGQAGFVGTGERHPGDFARPRRFEIAAVLNRMRSLRVK